MRVLFLTPELPGLSASGGTARMRGLSLHIAKRHEVAVLAYRDKGIDVSCSLEATGAYARLVTIVENDRLAVSRGEKRLGQLRSLIGRGSYERRVYRQARMQRALDRVCREWRPDVIVVEFAQMGYLQFPTGTPIVLDAHNVEHEIIERMAAVEGSLARRVYSRINAAKLRREEVALAQRVDAIAVTSERDREAFERLVPHCHPVVVPNGVDIASFRPRTEDPDGQSVVFFGALDYFPNADAVLYFAREILPLVRSATPGATFEVVGRRPPAELSTLANTPGIRIAGFVDDVRDAIAGASVVVVPLRAGGGTRLKVLEALAMGRPVVSTSLGIEGLDVVDGEHLQVADNPRDFARAVAMLLDSPGERERLGAAGRGLVEQRYDWQGIAGDFERLLVSVLESRAGHPG